MEGYVKGLKLALAACIALVASACGGIQSPNAKKPFDPQSCVESALRRGPDSSVMPMAFKSFAADCKAGDSVGCSALGVMYEGGLGVARDEVQAKRLFWQACQAGNVQGCVNFGSMLASGRGGARDVDTAARMLGKACAQGDARGCGQLASMYLNGVGDPVQAGHLFQIACQAGDAEACFELAKLNDHGALGNDSLRAMRYYESGCRGGHQPACLHADLIYSTVNELHRQASQAQAQPKRVLLCRDGAACAPSYASERVMMPSAAAPRQNGQRVSATY
jgi:TPR repeat protein